MYLYYRHIKTIAILHIRYCNSFTTGTQFQDFYCNNVSTTGLNKIQQYNCLFCLAWPVKIQDAEGGGPLLRQACWWLTRPTQDSQALPQQLQVEVWSGVGAEGSQSFSFVILPLFLSDDPSRVLKNVFYIKGGPVDCALLALPTGSGQWVSHGGTSSKSLWSSSVVPSCHGGQWTVLHALWL